MGKWRCSSEGSAGAGAGDEVLKIQGTGGEENSIGAWWMHQRIDLINRM